MKKTRSLPRILSFVAFIFSAVAFFCNFASAFDEDEGASRGNLFNAIYGMEGGDFRNLVVPLIIAMCLLSLLVIVSVAGVILGDTGYRIVGASELLFGLGSGVMYLLTPTFYMNANGLTSLNQTGDTGLGAGPICVAVFAFLAAAIGFITIFFGNRKPAAL